MKRGFYIILAAQFFSALADNALLIAALLLLAQLNSPEWMDPLLKLFFVFFYVILAPFVGAFADAMPKGRVMFISNTIKILGCALMLFDLHPLIAYAIVGLGAASYSPAKYGILTEYLPPKQLVIANGWMEGLTVTAIVLGVFFGGYLISPKIAAGLLAIDVPVIQTAIDTPAEISLVIITGIYGVAALFNLYIPKIAIDHKSPSKDPFFLIKEFSHCFMLLWRDRLGQVSLAVTTLFWGAGATLQFIVIKWAFIALGFGLDKAAQLQGAVAVGIAIGSAIAAKMISLGRALKVLPLGIIMGFFVILMVFVKSGYLAIALLIIIGGIAGLFVVPMNALLQYRGHLLMGAGHSIAVQNFNENLSILVMLAVYTILIKLDLTIYTVIVLFGLLISGIMTVLYNKYKNEPVQVI